MAPPLITMLDENRKPPHPLSWDEQDLLFPELVDHLQTMALFAVNTGLRDENLCGLRWDWEVLIPEIKRSIFIVSANEYKTRVPHVVILNDAAWSIIEVERMERQKLEVDGEAVSPFVFNFRYRGKLNRAGTMHNSA